MNVVIVGSGNVATHISLALKNAGITISQIWSKQTHHAQVLADQVGAGVILSLSEINREADFCIVAIKDDFISTIAEELSGFNGVIVHTSGAVQLSVFKDFEKYGVLYPLQTFSIKKEVEFNNIPICIEANNEVVLNVIRQLAEKLSSKINEVDSEKRKILHLAAVFACNFTNHLYALSADLLANYDLDFDLLKPLILETANKVQHALPNDVQTGPAIRNDEQTLKKHEELLLKQPQLLNIYQTLSESIKKTKK